MRHFADLFIALDQTTKINAKVDALAKYFSLATPQDKLWTVAILSHRRPKRTVNTTLLRTWAAEYGEIPLWLFEETYHIVGDLAETIAMILPKRKAESSHSLTYWIDYIKDLGNFDESVKKAKIVEAWSLLNEKSALFLIN